MENKVDWSPSGEFLPVGFKIEEINLQDFLDLGLFPDHPDSIAMELRGSMDTGRFDG